MRQSVCIDDVRICRDDKNNDARTYRIDISGGRGALHQMTKNDLVLLSNALLILLDFPNGRVHSGC